MCQPSASVLVRGQWGICIRETYTFWPFEPFSQVNEISLCLIAAVSQGVLSCIWFPVRRSCRQDWQAAEERLCKGNVLRCLVGKAARLVSGCALLGNSGTSLLSGVMKH